MLILDTHIAAWLVRSPSVLRQNEMLAIRSDRVAVSAISLWELRIKWDLFTAGGERKGPAEPRTVRDGLAVLGVELLPLTVDQAIAGLDPPTSHKDPFDTLLLAICQELGAKLLTRDAKLRDHPLALPL